MKVIYMEQTLALIAHLDIEMANKLVSQGEVKQTESGVRYLLIKEDGSTTSN